MSLLCNTSEHLRQAEASGELKDCLGGALRYDNKEPV